jgi:DNA-binding winged helix-turn-helix (wHTH) protein
MTPLLSDRFERAAGLRFGAFRLDFPGQRLLRREESVPLRAKTWSVLCYLASRPGLLVTKEELLDAVWPEVSVSEATLSSSISEIRAALGDPARRPEILVTVHGRGFRFVAEVEAVTDPAQGPKEAEDPWIGRQHELETLGSWIERASAGTRTIGFLHGEAGIGKTALARRAMGRSPTSFLLGIGQCVDRLCEGEAFGPILQALGQLAAGPGRERLLEALSVHAPSWLAQMPSLWSGVPEAERLRLAREAEGESPARATRRLAEALEALSAETLVVLWIEDLHWADDGTWDLLEVLARRPAPARLLILASHRPPLPDDGDRTNELGRRKPGLLHGASGRDLPLRPLRATDVADYLSHRCPGLPRDLSRLLHRHSGGNPLFLTAVVDLLVERGTIRRQESRWMLSEPLSVESLAVPDELQLLLRRELDSLAPDLRGVLEAASVAGLDFRARSVAAALDIPIDEAEEACERLVEQHQLHRSATSEAWADEPMSGCYSHTHALRRNAAYARVTGAKRIRQHRAIAEDLAPAHAAGGRTLAGEIAEHYLLGQAPREAIHYLCRAAEHSIALGAWSQARRQLVRARTLLANRPDREQADDLEIDLKQTWASLCFIQLGFGDESSYAAYDDIRKLGSRLGSHVLQARGLDGIGGYHLGRAEYVAVDECADDLIRLAERYDEPLYRMLGLTKRSCAAFYRAEFDRAAQAAREARLLYARTGPGRRESQVGTDPATVAGTHGAVALQALGRFEEAETISRETLAHARSLSDPYNECFALMYTAYYRWFRGDWDSALVLAEESQAMATRYGYGMQWIISRRFLELGQAELERPPLPEASPPEAVEAHAGGSQMGAPGLLWCVAREQLLRGRPEEADATAEAALGLSQQTAAPFQDAEILAVRGAAALALGQPESTADGWFKRAFEMARKQSIPWVELRILVDCGERMGLTSKRRARLSELVTNLGGSDSPLCQRARLLALDAESSDA